MVYREYCNYPWSRGTCFLDVAMYKHTVVLQVACLYRDNSKAMVINVRIKWQFWNTYHSVQQTV